MIGKVKATKIIGIKIEGEYILDTDKIPLDIQEKFEQLELEKDTKREEYLKMANMILKNYGCLDELEKTENIEQLIEVYDGNLMN